jgi:hypothetical protein
MYHKIVKNLFACPEAKQDFLLSLFPKCHYNVVENLLVKDILTYHEAKEHILHISSNHHSTSGALSKKSKPQSEADAVSSSNNTKN